MSKQIFLPQFKTAKQINELEIDYDKARPATVKNIHIAKKHAKRLIESGKGHWLFWRMGIVWPNNTCWFEHSHSPNACEINENQIYTYNRPY